METKSRRYKVAPGYDLVKSIAAIFAAVTILASVQSSIAATVVADLTTFNAETTGQNTVDFNGILGCSGPGCFQGFSPLVQGGISFSSSAPFVNVTSASYYTPTIFPGDFITNSYPPGGTVNSLTITLPTSVTAFGLNFGSFDGSTVSFLLSNGFSTTIGTSSTFGTLQFAGFLSNQAFNTITLSLPSLEGWIVSSVITATATTPLPAALPLFATGLGLAGFVARRRKRQAQAT
jgi:hypothetical protein